MDYPQAKSLKEGQTSGQVKAWILGYIQQIITWRKSKVNDENTLLLNSLYKPNKRREKQRIKALKQLYYYFKKLPANKPVYSTIKKLSQEEINHLTWAIAVFNLRLKEKPTDFVKWVFKRFNKDEEKI